MKRSCFVLTLPKHSRGKRTSGGLLQKNDNAHIASAKCCGARKPCEKCGYKRERKMTRKTTDRLITLEQLTRGAPCGRRTAALGLVAAATATMAATATV